MSTETPPSPPNLFGNIAQKIVDNTRPPTASEVFRAVGVTLVITMVTAPLSALILTTYLTVLWEWFLPSEPPPAKVLYGILCLLNLALAGVHQSITRYGHPRPQRDAIMSPWSTSISYVISSWLYLSLGMCAVAFTRIVLGWV